jgi:hypothetical protein
VSRKKYRSFSSSKAQPRYYSVQKTPRSGAFEAVLMKHGYDDFKGWIDPIQDPDV